MRSARTRKTPEDYPKFSFRLSQDDKDRLMAHLERLERLYARIQQPGEYAVRKNDILLDAAFDGLERLEKRLKARGAP
jgi:hypothetical protein